jgi:hypothetical protein
MKTISGIQRLLDDDRSAPPDIPWVDINNRVKPALDEFEDAARQELEIPWTP